MKSYKRIFEAKQVGILYHIIDLEGMITLLKNKSLKGFNYTYISTTRSKSFNDYLGSRPSSYFKLELNGDKLSEKYKIEPNSYQSSTGISFEEYEEVIKTSEIKNIFIYINKIIFLIDKFESGRYSQKDVLLDDEGYNTFGKRFKLIDLKNMINSIPKKLIYVQKGSRVYQDFNNLFKEII
jgi:cytochrome b involved in lipid metabolism